ncbi:MAG: alpha/beta hydrolase [Acetobacteraceae bacterium]|nr:alpha/beta hydrolase [Acetobacteraceae bacterium]
MADAEIERIRALLLARPRPPELSERRRRLDMLGEQSPLPADVRVTPETANGVAAEWTVTPEADPSRVLLFLHGGGYVSGSIASHRSMVAEAGRQAKARTLALGYRLAPEHPYPAALEDALAGFRFLVASGFDPGRIALSGDSAGGGITVATLVTLRDNREALPGCAWCISPWVDLEMTGASMSGKARIDPLIGIDYLRELAGLYLGGADPRLPKASPLHADLRGLPPMLIQCGSAETLLDDSVRLAGAAARADVAVTLEIYPDMIHVWPLFHQQVAAGRRALAAAGRFIRAAIG